MPRSDRWKDPRWFSLAITNGDKNPGLVAAVNECEGRHDTGGFSEWSIVGAARELVLCVSPDGSRNVRIVMFTLDAESGELMLSEVLEMIDFTDDEFKKTMAIALYHEVPIFPEDALSAQELERLYHSLIEDGFVAKTTDHDETRLVLTERPLLLDGTSFPRLDKASLQPADVLISHARRADREQRLAEAERIMSSLREAVDELEASLASDVRDENRIQRCLTRFPILFGLEYRSIIPKHTLGKEYELDYALERVSGLIDLLEIEASNLELFTKKGDARKELVHAEQQVLDWLDWIDAHAEYSRNDLPGLVRPRGYIVIGRRGSLGDDGERRLRRRNLVWNESLTVLTYDDVLDRALNMLELLSGKPGEEDL